MFCNLFWWYFSEPLKKTLLLLHDVSEELSLLLQTYFAWNNFILENYYLLNMQKVLL